MKPEKDREKVRERQAGHTEAWGGHRHGQEKPQSSSHSFHRAKLLAENVFK